VSLLVERVTQVEAPQESVLRELGGPRQIPSAVGLGLRKAEELATAPVCISKDEPMNRREEPFEPAGSEWCGSRDLPFAYTHATRSATMRRNFLPTTVPLSFPSALRPTPTDRGSVVFWVNVISLSLGAALLTWAIRADADWFDRHVLPTYCPRAPSTLVFETCARWSAAFAAALVVLFVRPKLGRWAARRERPRLWYAAARLAGAVSLALVVCDVVLRFRQRPRRLEDDEDLQRVKAFLSEG